MTPTLPSTGSTDQTTATFDAQVEGYADVSRLDALRRTVAARGGADLDVTWFIQDSPLGPLLLAARAQRLIRVAFEGEEFDAVQEDLAQRFGTRMLRTDHGLGNVRTQLDEYFDGQRREFTAPVDFACSSGPFRMAVQRTLPQIEFGHVATYQELAAIAGRPRAVRAAATACATNPLPIVVPCHRIVRSDGSIGAYLGGSDAKRWLLHHEGAPVG